MGMGWWCLPSRGVLGISRDLSMGRLWTRAAAPRGLGRGAPGAHREGLFVPDSKDTEAGGDQAAEPATPLQREGRRGRGLRAGPGGRGCLRVKPCLLQQGLVRSLGTFPRSPTTRSGPWARGDTRGREDMGVHTGAQLGTHADRDPPAHQGDMHTHTRARPYSDTHTDTHTGTRPY